MICLDHWTHRSSMFFAQFFGWETIWQKSEKRKPCFFGTKGKGLVAVLFLQPFFGVFFIGKPAECGWFGPFLKFSSQFRPGFGLRATFGSFAVCLHSKNSVQTVGARLATNLSIGKFVVTNDDRMTG